MTWTAYTVGNAHAYDRALREGPISKQPGGVIFRTSQAARDRLAGGCLPPEYAGGKLGIRAAVYRLRLEKPVLEISKARPDWGEGARELLEISRILHRTEPPA